MLAVPEVGARKPVSIFMVVDLPAPLGPRKPSTSPGWTWNDRSSTAVCCAKRLVRFLISIMASHRREGHCAQRNHRTRAGRKNAEHANHRPGRGQDRSKTEKFSQHPETSSKWNMWSAIQRAQHRKPPAVEHMGVDHGGLHIRVAEQLLNSANVLTCL